MAEQYAVQSISSLTSGVRINFRSTVLPFAGRIRKIIVVATPTAAGASTFDINLDGETIFGSPAERPVLPSGESEVVLAGLSVPHGENARLSLDADSIPLGGLSAVSVVVISDDMRADKPAPIEFFVQAMYLGALNRDPDEDELADALTLLTAACHSFGFIDEARALGTTIFTSADFLALTLTTEEYVNRLYKTYLNRDPEDPEDLDTDGRDFWVTSIENAITGGATVAAARASARNAFAVSTEFTNRAPVFCRSQAPAADATSIEGKTPTAFVQDTLATIYTVNAATAALANNAGADLGVDMGAKFWKLLQITTDRACRVRFYSRASYRTADVARAIGTDPTGEHGLLAEFVIEASNLTLDCAPIPEGLNLDDLTATTSFVRVENKSGATSAVALTLKIRKV